MHKISLINFIGNENIIHIFQFLRRSGAVVDAAVASVRECPKSNEKKRLNINFAFSNTNLPLPHYHQALCSHISKRIKANFQFKTSF